MRIAACLGLVSIVLLQPADKVVSTVDRKVDFGSLRTYAWGPGHHAYDPAAHQLIVEAVDEQLSGLGFKKADPKVADAHVKYHAVRESEVDLEALERAQNAGQKERVPEGLVGVVMVVMYRPEAPASPLWSARTRRALSNDAGTRAVEIRRAVAALFESYPSRSGPR